MDETYISGPSQSANPDFEGGASGGLSGGGPPYRLIHLCNNTPWYARSGSVNATGAVGTSRLRTNCEAPATPKNEAIPKKMKQFDIDLQNGNEVQANQMWGNEKMKVKRERREVGNEKRKL